jgi:primosomal protein N'
MSGTPIMLKMESKLMGVKMDTVAKKIDTKAAVPADVFKLPDNVNITYSKEADEMSHTMITSMIESMKDPDAANKLNESIAKSKMQMEQAQRQQAQEREADATNDEGETSSDPDEKQLDEMMQKGMDTFKGLFK